MQKAQSKSSESTNLHSAPQVLDLDVLEQVAGGGPNGGWAANAGPNGGWATNAGPNGGWSTNAGPNGGWSSSLAGPNGGW
ncbi:MAG: hypothetical protein JSR59_18400 [Proteobacteria bacterium]|nr:hypothetical protein [Pseudomonadota bacterium]